jgi:predicted dienelactone hydrolase
MQNEGQTAFNPGFEIPPYAERGPYPVGTQQMPMDGEDPLDIHVWYPASNVDRRDQEIKYPYEIKMFKPFGMVSIASYKGNAIQEAAYNRSMGPYPLVILSPGFSIGSSAYAWLAEHLASYGFVVISPDHAEHLNPEDQLWRSAITRPQDILAVFDEVDQAVEPGGVFAGLVDPERVAVIGHSYGGYTALAAAGARIDTPGFEAHCQKAIEEEAEAAWLCEMLIPHLADMAALAGLDAVPAGLWPAQADPRVDAVVSLAGDAFFFGQEGLSEITVPVMAMGGTADVDSPFLWGTQPTYEFTTGQPRAKFALQDAEHMIFTGLCESTPWVLKFFSAEFCSDSTWDRAYAHTLTENFVTAFLLSTLMQDQNAASSLSPQDVDFMGIDYEATGYGK